MSATSTKRKGFVLRETVSKRWFAKMVAIGPMLTAKKSEATVFASRKDAAMSPAMRFPLTLFRVEKIP